MDLKTFRAKTLHEAMHAAKAALGPDAVILETKTLTALGSAVGVELIAHAAVRLAKPVRDVGAFRSTPWAPSAASPADLPSPAPTKPPAARPAEPAAAAPIARVHAPTPASVPAAARVFTKPSPPADVAAPLAQVQRDLAEIKSLLTSAMLPKPAPAAIIPAAQAPETPDPVAALLRAAGVPTSLPRRGGPTSDPAAAALDDLRAALPDIDLPSLLQGAVALVGARGAGRTTAVVKLASLLKYSLGRKPAILALADDALETEALARLADAMEVPFSSPGLAVDIRASIDDLDGADVVLIDTPGLSPQDAEAARTLRDRLDAAGVKTLAVLPATASPSSAGKLCAQVRPFRPIAALLTRMDEAGLLGHWVQVLGGASPLPVGALGEGPDGPEGLEFCAAAAWAARILAAPRSGADLA